MSCLNCFKRRDSVSFKSAAATKKDVKKVTFSDTVKVIYFNKVPNDSNVCWQRAARDRMRFSRRVLDIEKQIGWVFTPQHRNRMYNMIYL
jgi:hypothetical protein